MNSFLTSNHFHCIKRVIDLKSAYLYVYLNLILISLSISVLADNTSPILWHSANEPGGGGAVVALAVSPHDSSCIIASGDMFGAAISTDRGLSWKPVSGFLSYEMCDITWHPDSPEIVWMGSLTGPYLSKDGGRNWEIQRNGMPALCHWSYSCPIEKILYVPGEVNHLLAISGSSRHWGNVQQFRGVWESNDNGDNWSFVSNITNNGITYDKDKPGLNIYRAVFSAGESKELYVVADTVWCSNDLGKTWKIRNNGLPYTKPDDSRTFATIGNIQAHPIDPQTFWVSVNAYFDNNENVWLPGGIFKTVDGGLNWFPITNGLTQDKSDRQELASSYQSLAISSVNPDIIWTCDTSFRHCLVYKTEDGGKHWFGVAKKGGTPEKQDKVSIVPTACFAGSSMSGFAADPSDTQAVYCWCTEYIFRTLDGGETWIDTMSENTVPNKYDYWRGRGWTGWCARNIGFNPYKKDQCILQGMDACRGWMTSDNFSSYKYVSTEPVPWLAGNDVSFAKDGVIYIATGQFGGFAGIICSKNFGDTFVSYYGKEYGLPDMSWGGTDIECMGIYTDPDNSNIVWATIGGLLYHSEDGGMTWNAIINDLKLTKLAGNPLKQSVFYVAGKDGIYYFQDEKVTLIGGPSPGGRGKLSCDSTGRLYVCQFRDGRPGLWRFTPESSKWELLLDEPLAMQCAIDPSNDNRLLLVTSQDPYNDYAGGNGIWTSSDSGKSWNAENTGLPMLRCNTSAFNPYDTEQIVVGTYGAGFYIADWPNNYQPTGTRTYTMNDDDKKLISEYNVISKDVTSALTK